MLIVRADPFERRRQTTIPTPPSGSEVPILLTIMLTAYGIPCCVHVIVHNGQIANDVELIMLTEQG